MSKKILVVDDEDNLRFLVVKFLEMAGYAVTEAEDGDMGIKTAQTLQPDLILLDVMMPKKDGYQVAKELAADKKLSAIPIILMTGTSQVVGPGIQLSTPAKFKLAKPFSKEELYEVVKKALG
jgi:CheY-like chemotaxis protein